MPEGPEVTTIATQLNALVSGKYLHQIIIKDGPYKTSTQPQYIDTRRRIVALGKKKDPIQFIKVGKHGKFIYFELKHANRDTFVIGNTLALTGEWHLQSDKEPTQKIYPKIEISFGDEPTGPSRTLVFSDKLGMGRFWVESLGWLKHKLQELGPDVMEPEFTLERFMTLESKKPIYMALVDQSLMSGIGNYLRSEILGQSNIDPWQRLCDATTAQKKKLYTAIKNTVKDVLGHGGVSEEDRVSYRDLFGNPGRYELSYYKKTSSPDGKPIKSVKDSDGRMFYYVA